MVEIRFDTYYRYDDLTRILRGLADEYPKLVRLESIGKSHEGREVWLVTVTNFEAGDDKEKPALWIDGNIHATEVSPLERMSLSDQQTGQRIRIKCRHHALSRHARVLHLPARQPRWRGMGVGRQTQTHPLQHAALPIR